MILVRDLPRPLLDRPHFACPTIVLPTPVTRMGSHHLFWIYIFPEFSDPPIRRPERMRPFAARRCPPQRLGARPASADTPGGQWRSGRARAEGELRAAQVARWE